MTDWPTVDDGLRLWL